jgi:ankyrin repeat protein
MRFKCDSIAIGYLTLSTPALTLMKSTSICFAALKHQTGPRSLLSHLVCATTIVLTVVYFYAAMRPLRRFVYRFRSTAGNSADGLNPDQPTSLMAATDNDPGDSGICLHEAAAKGLEQTILKRLSERAAINALDSEGFAALHLAIREGHVGAVKLLLDQGADVEAPCKRVSARPVHVAARSLNPTMMATLLKFRPNLESRSNGLTALFYAIGAGDEEVVRLLLEAGADAKARTLGKPGTGESVLHMAVASWKQSMLPLLIRYGADVNASGTNPAGQTALHIAAQHGNEDALRELIKAGANVFAKDANGLTALHVTAAYGRINTASILLDQGLDITAEDGRRITPVDMAAINNMDEMVRFLLDMCASSMSEELKIHTVVKAAWTGRLNILKILDGEGFPILGRDDLGWSGLSAAAYSGHKDVVVFLLRRGANPQQRSNIGAMTLNATVFDMATLGGHDDVVQLLQDAERQRAADPNAELFPEWENTSSNESSPSRQAEFIALSMSVHATRRIHANQEPAGIFSCNVCKGLDFRRGMPRDAELVYFMSIASMSSSASRGCRGCQFLSDCLTQIKNVYGEGLWGNRPMTDLILHSMALGGPLQLLLYAGDFTSISSMRIEIYVKEGKHDSTLIP